MLSAQDLSALTPGTRVNFLYQFPASGTFLRRGTVETVRDLGASNVIDAEGNIVEYAKNPPRPKGRYLLTIYDETAGNYRSFYTAYINKFSKL